MANGRTFSSWLVTGLGAIGVGAGQQVAFGKIDPTRAAKSVATVFIVTAILIFPVGVRRSDQNLSRLRKNDTEATPSRSFAILACSMTTAAVATGVISWLP